MRGQEIGSPYSRENRKTAVIIPDNMAWREFTRGDKSDLVLTTSVGSSWRGSHSCQNRKKAVSRDDVPGRASDFVVASSFRINNVCEVASREFRSALHPEGQTFRRPGQELERLRLLLE